MASQVPGIVQSRMKKPKQVTPLDPLQPMEGVTGGAQPAPAAPAAPTAPGGSAPGAEAAITQGPGTKPLVGAVDPNSTPGADVAKPMPRADGLDQTAIDAAGPEKFAEYQKQKAAFESTYGVEGQRTPEQEAAVAAAQGATERRGMVDPNAPATGVVDRMRGMATEANQVAQMRAPGGTATSHHGTPALNNSAPPPATAPTAPPVANSSPPPATPAPGAPTTTPPKAPTVDWGGQQQVRNVKGNQTFAIDPADPAFAGKQGINISIASAKPRPGEYANVLLRDKDGNVVKRQDSGGAGSGMVSFSADGLPPEGGPYTLDIDTNMQDYHINRRPRDVATPDGALDPSWKPGIPTGGNTPAPNAPNPIGRPPGPPIIPGGTGPTGNNPAAREGGGIGATGSTGETGWTPTGGIVDQVRGITPQTVEGAGYTATTAGAGATSGATGFNATGYNATMAPGAEGYDPVTGEVVTADENMSGAIDRIIGADSALMRRAAAKANIDAQSRGLGNSSMAVGAAQAALLDQAQSIAAGDIQSAQFNAQQRNQMAAFNAEQKNAAAQFLAAEKNQNGRFNAQQSNDAAKFAAEATNRAAEFLATAQNIASQFNAGESNKLAMFAAEQVNQAARFSAEMENAAKQFNATAFNQAQQRYTDAINAALAAQNDAVNLSRRDAAQNNFSAGESQKDRDSRQALQSAQIEADLNKFQLSMDADEKRAVSQLNAQMFGAYQSGLTSIMSQEMEPEARANALRNYNAVWAATGYLPFDIDMNAFPAGTGAPPGATGATGATEAPPPSTRPPPVMPGGDGAQPGASPFAR